MISSYHEMYQGQGTREQTKSERRIDRKINGKKTNGQFDKTQMIEFGIFSILIFDPRKKGQTNITSYQVREEPGEAPRNTMILEFFFVTDTTLCGNISTVWIPI